MKVVTEHQKMAEKIAHAMQLKGLSQARLARESGQSPMQVCRVLSGEYMPSAISLHRIAKALDREISDFMD